MSQTMISEYKLKLIDKKLLETKLKEMKNLQIIMINSNLEGKQVMKKINYILIIQVLL